MTLPIDSMDYPERLRALIPDGDEMELAAGQPRTELRNALQQFDLAAMIAPRKIVDASLATACHAGLWLANNFLEESHHISQSIETPTGSFWHAIMHRREGDFDNACYWFRRVRDHEVYQPLFETARACAAKAQDDRLTESLNECGRWDSMAFVDLVRKVMAGRTSESTARACRRIARREWELLFDYCYRTASRVA